MKDEQNNIPASYLILEEDDKVLLLRRYNTGYEDGNYSFIAGHVEAGESFTQCIIREAYEEAGIILHPDDLEVVHVMHRNSGQNQKNERIDVFFSAGKWTGSIENREPHKCDDLSWFNMNELPLNTIPYIKESLGKIRKRVTYSEQGWGVKSS